jgi:hypothetical protein
MITEETQQWLDEVAQPDFLDRLKTAMKARKLSQVAFADYCGVSPSWIGVVLRGDCPHRGARHVPKGIWRQAKAMRLV